MTDKTIIIPTPGKAQKAPQPRPSVQPGSSLEPLKEYSALNPVVSAASTLLALMIKLRTTTEFNRAPQLHQQITSEIQRFDQKLQTLDMKPESTVAARYLMCTVMDETVMNTPWGASSGWSQRSLLSIFHRETFGGEKCFAILRRLQETASINTDLLELFYLCLSLGFEGRFRLVPNKHAQLETIRENLYRIIQSHRNYNERELSPVWQGATVIKPRVMEYIPLWVFASVAMAIVLAGYAGLSFWLMQNNQPVIDSMQLLMG